MLFPRYDITEPWHLDDLIRIMYDSGEFDTFIADVIATNDLPLGTFSCAITHPVNGKIVLVLVDAKQSRLVGMRVCEGNFGFIPIKHDRASLEQVVEDIKNDTLPLFNVCESDEVMNCPAYAGERR
jgi:hypothetical protein